MEKPLTMLGRAQRWLTRRRRTDRPAAERRSNLALREAIDLVVAGTDPRIRAVSGYGRKLRPAVERMLAYLDTCRNWLAPPIEISAPSWSSDPLLRALFVNVDDMQQLFSENKELRAFFASHPQCTEAYVGLGVTRQERRTLGVALAGELLQREVAQTVVSFTDGRVFGACASESELRANVERRGFGFLVGEALEQLLAEHTQHRGLEEEQHLISLRLKALEQQRNAVDALVEANGGLDEQIAQLRERLLYGQQALGQAHTHPATLEDYITRISEVLGHPERHLTQKRISLRINRMNVKIDSSNEPADELLFSEIAIGRHRPRVVLLARYPRSALLPERDRLDEAQRLLGSSATG